MKTKEELEALRKEAEELRGKLEELTPEEQEKVIGGATGRRISHGGGAFADETSEVQRVIISANQELPTANSLKRTNPERAAKLFGET